jgi:thiamine monophosphate synthase
VVTPSGLVVLTDRRLAAGPLVEVVTAAVRGGAAWVVLRERDLPYAERRRLAVTLRDRLPPGRLIVAGPDPLCADAVHLSEADPLPAAGVSLAGRSCHGAPELSIEDYVTLSPIYPTSTKPGYGPALGPAVAAALAGEVPWLALGGIDTPARAAECAAAGARGIAVMGAVMRAADPEAVARALATAFGAERSARVSRSAHPTGAMIAAGAAGSARPTGTARPAGAARPAGPSRMGHAR